jgi:LmbE family N-acetylglucosaminyl deacetylase
MRLLSVQAHFDDFEFTAAGTFEMWRRKADDPLRARVLVCTDGQAGHHALTRKQTGRVRLREQQASARIGQYEFKQLILPDGRLPRDSCLQVTTGFLAALWKAIRDFEPDYLFCPPLPPATLAGIHVDHVAVAEAVRKVAYMINVPHAFTPEYPADETHSRPVRVPVILNVYDAYMFGVNAPDLVVDVEPAFDRIVEMSWCHQSQIREWLPWVGRHQIKAPRSPVEWSVVLRDRFRRQQRELGLRMRRATEVFTVTAWGSIPKIESLVKDFPKLVHSPRHLGHLRKRLWVWNRG